MGLPHDGNARHALGGVAGNAGLFGSAEDLLIYGRAWLAMLRGEENGLLTPSLARLAVADHTSALGPPRGAGLGPVPAWTGGAGGSPGSLGAALCRAGPLGRH